MAKRAGRTGRTRGKSVSPGTRKGTSKITQPDFLLKDRSKARSAKRLSGNPIKQPGFKLLGTGKAAPSEKLQNVKIKKVVDPQRGQSPATPGAGFKYYGRTDKVLNVTRKRVPRTVAPNSGQKVIRPKTTAVRVGVGGRTKIKNV